MRYAILLTLFLFSASAVPSSIQECLNPERCREIAAGWSLNPSQSLCSAWRVEKEGVLTFHRRCHDWRRDSYEVSTYDRDQSLPPENELRLKGKSLRCWINSEMVDPSEVVTCTPSERKVKALAGESCDRGAFEVEEDYYLAEIPCNDLCEKIAKNGVSHHCGSDNRYGFFPRGFARVSGDYACLEKGSQQTCFEAKPRPRAGKD